LETKKSLDEIIAKTKEQNALEKLNSIRIKILDALLMIFTISDNEFTRKNISIPVNSQTRVFNFNTFMLKL
jgi:hypothetical protein